MTRGKSLNLCLHARCFKFKQEDCSVPSTHTHSSSPLRPNHFARGEKPPTQSSHSKQISNLYINIQPLSTNRSAAEGRMTIKLQQQKGRKAERIFLTRFFIRNLMPKFVVVPIINLYVLSWCFGLFIFIFYMIVPFLSPPETVASHWGPLLSVNETLRPEFFLPPWKTV